MQPPSPDSCKIIIGDCLESLRSLPDESVHCCITSPPYFGLRDYGHAGQIGLEETPDAYVTKMVEVFREVRRVLRADGTLWLNLGDSYCSVGGIHAGRSDNQPGVGAGNRQWREGSARADGDVRADGNSRRNRNGVSVSGLKPKDLIGTPWRVAFALQADGWWLRQDIIWAKPNPMPESVRDRCTKAHEYIFMLTKSAKYFYAADAIKNPPSEALLKQIAEGYNGSSTKEFQDGGAQDASATKSRIIENARKKIDKQRGHSRRHAGFNDRWNQMTREEQASLGSNKRSVWTVATRPYRGAHFATFPPDLIRPCIKAGCPAGGVVLDPFGGSGTVGQVAMQEGRESVLLELNPDYRPLIEQRIADTIKAMTPKPPKAAKVIGPKPRQIDTSQLRLEI